MRRMARAASELTRREFLVTSAVAAGVGVAGYTLATGPVNAAAIATDTSGLDAGVVSIPAADRAIPGYRAKPKGGTRLPVVIVVQEIFGIHEYIRDVCRRLAKAGYLAVAPDLYVRQGDVSGMTSIDEIRGVVMRVPDAQVLGDLDAAAAWAASDGGDAAKLGITGFCWGGRMVWLYAAHSNALKAGVAWYGRLVGEPTPLFPKSPLDVAASLRAPVLGLYGAEDTGIPLDTVERMRAALAAAKSPSKIEVFPGAPHGFHADYRPSYKPDAAEKGWKLLLDWFASYGVKA
jgi:carboxymethylenebutenolidase